MTFLELEAALERANARVRTLEAETSATVETLTRLVSEWGAMASVLSVQNPARSLAFAECAGKLNATFKLLT